MSAAQPIGPGSIVVCVSTGQNELSGRFLPAHHLTKGALYCVEVIRPWANGCPLDGCNEGFVLKGRSERYVTPFGNMPFGYCPSQFRPLNDGDTSLVTEEIEDGAAGDGDALQTYRIKTPEPV